MPPNGRAGLDAFVVGLALAVISTHKQGCAAEDDSAVSSCTNGFAGPKCEFANQLYLCGYDCPSGDNSELNKAYIYKGTTKDGRPYYRTAGSSSAFVASAIPCPCSSDRQSLRGARARTRARCHAT